MSQPEENREKSAKTDAVLRPPSVTPKPAPPRKPRGGRGGAEGGPAKSAPESVEEE